MRPLLRLLLFALLIALATAAFRLIQALKESGAAPETVTLVIAVVSVVLSVLLGVYIGDLYRELRDRWRLWQIYDAAQLEINERLEDVGHIIRLFHSIGARPVDGFRLPSIIDQVLAEPAFYRHFTPILRDHLFTDLGSAALAPTVKWLETYDGHDPAPYREELAYLFTRISFQRSWLDVEKVYLTGLVSSRRAERVWRDLNKQAEQERKRLESKRFTAEFIDKRGNSILSPRPIAKGTLIFSRPIDP